MILQLALALLAQGQDLATIDVHVRVVFGPLERAPLERLVEVAAGSNVVDATRALTEVDQDWLCCDENDVWAIDGIGPDPMRDGYWMWNLNGELGPDLAQRHVLEDGDGITWNYRVADPEGLGAELEARVVSMVPSATEILRAVGARRALVGISPSCRPDPLGARLPRVASSGIDSEAWDMRRIDAEVRAASAEGRSLYSVDRALIAELEPTLVFGQGRCPVCAVPAGDVHAAARAVSCPEVGVLSAGNLAEVAASIADVGARVGRKGAATIAKRAFERRLEAVAATAAARNRRPRVLVLEWFDPPWVSGEWIAEMVALAGGEPVLIEVGEHSKRVRWEDVRGCAPDLVLLAPCDMSVERGSRELGLLRQSEVWRGLEAVRAGDVWILDGASFSTPGPALARGAEILSELFGSDDPQLPENEALRVR